MSVSSCDGQNDGGQNDEDNCASLWICEQHVKHQYSRQCCMVSDESPCVFTHFHGFYHSAPHRSAHLLSPPAEYDCYAN